MAQSRASHSQSEYGLVLQPNAKVSKRSSRGQEGNTGLERSDRLGSWQTNSNAPEFTVVLLNQQIPPNGIFRKVLAASVAPLHGKLQQWWHYSLLRLVLRESRSGYYRILSSRSRRTVLNFAEVRRSLPRVDCSDSRNELQFCSASIEKLSDDRPYLTLEDCRIFAEGFFLAEKWYAHMGMLCRDKRSDSLGALDEQQVYAASSSSAIDQT